VNINTADVAELSTLSGIGASRAQAIIDYRERNGAFTSIEDIKNVEGIKDGLFSKIKDKITV
jgi:competence protein ComEA